MQKEVPGKPEFTAHHRGLCYLFPSADQRAMFLANPAKYAVKPSEESGAAPGPQSSNAWTDGTSRTVSVTGQTSCAGCEHGVKPLGDPDQHGLAVVDDAGKIYVVEAAHTLYPRLYEDRFEGRRLALTGEVLRQEGAVAWVRPISLRAAR